MKCEIIRDLMPLYLDECCSEGSRELVEEHIQQCESCRKILGEMSREIIVGTEEKQKNLQEEELLQTGKEVIKTKIREDYIGNMVRIDIIFNMFLLIFGICTLPHWNMVNMVWTYTEISRMKWGPELFINIYGSAGTPIMSGLAIYWLVGNVKYLMNEWEKCQTAILTAVMIQSLVFKLIMVVTYAILGFSLILG